MGFLSKITKPISKTVKKVGDVATDAVVNPVSKVGTEIGRGANAIGNYPEKIVGSAGQTIGSLGAPIGQGVGNLFQGVAPGVNALLPAAQGLLSTYLDPAGYAARKAPFPSNTNTQYQPPIQTQIIPGSSNKIYMIAAIAVVLLIAIFFIFKKKR